MSEARKGQKYINNQNLFIMAENINHKYQLPDNNCLSDEL